MKCISSFHINWEVKVMDTKDKIKIMLIGAAIALVIVYLLF